IRMVGAPAAAVGSVLPVVPNTNVNVGAGGRGTPDDRRSPYMRPGAASLPFVEGRGTHAPGVPHLSLNLDDAPPGAEGRWRLMGGSAHSLLLGSSSSLAPSAEWGEGPGRRGTFGVGGAQYHPAPGHESEHGSFHSRLDSSLNSSSLSSGSHSHGHSQLPSGATSHSLYPSSGSGSGSASARAHALAHAGSVEGPLSPSVSAFGHRLRDGEHSGSSGSGGRRQENSSGSANSHNNPDRARSPLSGPASPLLSPWAGGLDPD
ncbi:hypothetical protein DFH06DRAFT_1238616, partial [Mycena polygramma]